MEIKKTQLYAAELEVIADTLQSNYCRRVLKEAAQRLSDLKKIAEYYQAEASRLAEIVNGGNVVARECKKTVDKRFPLSVSDSKGEEKCKAMYPKR